MDTIVNPQRILTPAQEIPGDGPIIYWMSRDQRVQDNWALIHAVEIARSRKVPVAVVFTLARQYLGAAVRHYDFMIRGLQLVRADLARHRIPFFILSGDPPKCIRAFARKHKVSAVVTDFSPIRLNRQWKDEVSKSIGVPLIEVDAHNVVPCTVASDKREFAAYTFRPKIKRLLEEFLTGFPALRKHPYPWPGSDESADWEFLLAYPKTGRLVPPVDRPQPGGKNANKVLLNFLERRLNRYDALRNDPSEKFQSDLSPYLHFGQISAQRVALEIRRFSADQTSVDAFLEELIVRRELSDNYCYYTPDYDSFAAFPDWAKATLDKHRKDRRKWTYPSQQFERAETHDRLWNAAQIELVHTGKMHGYMRMYWAKKILEWTESPEQALEIAVYLNDRYSLDGRDPNGYTGIAWSIGGVHDRAWPERPIFGKIRYMSYDGCKRKFNIDAYINRVESETGETIR